MVKLSVNSWKIFPEISNCVNTGCIFKSSDSKAVNRFLARFSLVRFKFRSKTPLGRASNRLPAKFRSISFLMPLKTPREICSSWFSASESSFTSFKAWKLWFPSCFNWFPCRCNVARLSAPKNIFLGISFRRLYPKNKLIKLLAPSNCGFSKVSSEQFSMRRTCRSGKVSNNKCGILAMLEFRKVSMVVPPMGACDRIT